MAGPPARVIRTLAGLTLLVALVVTAPARAGVVDTYECRRDLAMADQLVTVSGCANSAEGRFCRAVPAAPAEPRRHGQGAIDGPLHDRTRPRRERRADGCLDRRHQLRPRAKLPGR
jgi:hypothetical protein